MDSLQRIRTGMFCTMESNRLWEPVFSRKVRYRYDKVQVKKQDSPKKNMGYTAYNLNVLGYEEFAKRVELLFKDTDAVNDPQYKTMMEAFANHAFLRRIHTVDNAAIPYQLHAEVVNRIIDNQGRFYPWLIDAREHILKVLTSRIPYYVGPLDSTDHGKAGENGTRFAWVKRLAGHEDAFHPPHDRRVLLSRRRGCFGEEFSIV